MKRSEQAPRGTPVGWYEGMPVSHPAEKPVDAEDPFDAVALRVPMENRDQGLLDAARCFVEEFITMGYTDAMISSLFRKPFYMGLHPVYERRGETFVRDFIAECRAQLAASGVYPRRSQGGE